MASYIPLRSDSKNGWFVVHIYKCLKVLPVSFIDSNQPNLDDLCNTNLNDSVWSMYCRPMSPPSIPSIPCRSLKLDSLVDPTLLIMIMPVTSIHDNPFLFIWFSQSKQDHIHCALKGWKYIGLGRLYYLGIILYIYIGVPEHQEFCWRTLFPDQVATTLQTCNLFRPSAL